MQRNQEGQSTVEFALVMILFMSYILFFFQLSMVFGFGNFVHYATFMSARAFLSAGSSLEDQQARATYVITSTLKKSAGDSANKFPSIAMGIGDGQLPGFQVVTQTVSGSGSGDSSLDWMHGVRYTFKSKLFMIPLGGFGQSNASANSVTLKSESWLGREPSLDECQHDLGQLNGLFDNGC